MMWSFFRLLAAQGIQYRRTQGRLWASYTVVILLALVMFLGLPLARFSHDWRVGAQFALVPLVIIMMYVWQLVVAVVPILNSPNHARLIPGARRKAMIVVASMWFACVLLIGIVAGFVFQNGIVLACFLGLSLAGIALISTGCKEGMFFHAASFVLVVNRDAYRLFQDASMLAVLVAATLVCAAYAIYRLFPVGDRHWRIASRVDAMKATQLGDLPRARNFAMDPAGWLYRRILARDCRQAGTGTLLWHVLGPRAHWSAPVTYTLLALALLFAWLSFVATTHWSLQFWQGFTLGLLGVAVLFGPLMHTQQIAIRMHATRAEQELVRLSPRMPQNRQLNQVFVRHVLWQSAGMFAMVLAATVYANVMCGGAWNDVVNDLCQSSVLVILSAGVLRWVTKEGKPSNVWPAVIMLLLVLAIFLPFWWVNRAVTLPWPVLALVSFFVAAVLLVRDVRKIMAGPVVLPLARA